MDKLIRIQKSDIKSFDPPSKIKLNEIYDYFIFNQGHNLSCAISSAISLIEYLRQKEGKSCEKLSVGFLYHELLMENKDSLSHIGFRASDVLRELLKNGVCLQQKFSSLQDSYINPSTDAVLDSLSRIKHCNIECIDIDIITLRYIIGFCERPIVAIINIFDTDQFFDLERSYEVIRPFEDMDKEESLNHSILLVGYNDHEGVIYFQNSYGEEWGNGGFGRISYDYIPYFDLFYSMDESCIKSS